MWFKDTSGNSLNSDYVVGVHAHNTGSTWIIRAAYINENGSGNNVQLGTDTYASQAAAQTAIDRMLQSLNPDNFS